MACVKAEFILPLSVHFTSPSVLLFFQYHWESLPPIYLSEYASNNRWTRTHPPCHYQSCGYSLGCVWFVWFGFVRFVPAIRHIHSCRVTYTFDHDPACHYQHSGRSIACCSASLPHSEHFPRRNPLADHSPNRIERSTSWNSHGCYSRP